LTSPAGPVLIVPVRRIIACGLIAFPLLVACSGDDDDVAPGAATPPMTTAGPGAAAPTGAQAQPAQGATTNPATPVYGTGATVLKPDPPSIPTAFPSGMPSTLPSGLATAFPSGFPTTLPTTMPTAITIPTSIPIPTVPPPATK
jgi:hypothetical protein